MHQQLHPLLSPSLGTQRQLVSWHFGTPGAGRKVYIQASLHADELPGMLVSDHLLRLLEVAEDRGEVLGEVVLVPMANPIGLSQTVMHHQIGRFELGSMENFNRHYPDLFQLVKEVVAHQLGPDPQRNKRLIRTAMRQALAAQAPSTELQSQRQVLMSLAHDADLVLDLHCDFEAVMHLYVEQPVVDQITPLARYLGARAVLWARGSGPLISFDEALSGPWWRLQEHFKDLAPIPLACASTTVDCVARLTFPMPGPNRTRRPFSTTCAKRGVLASPAPALPTAMCDPTPLTATDDLHAPHPGVIVFQRQLGDTVKVGDVLAHIVDPLNRRRTPVTTRTDGVIYARHNLRWATTGMEICRVAGTTPLRSGNLLSP